MVSQPMTLSVIVAVQHAATNLPDVVAALEMGRHPDVEFIFAHTPEDGETPRLLPALPNVRALCLRRGSLIPHLWREGIRSARGQCVATTTAACVPAPGWVNRLIAADMSGIAGLGGTIANDPEALARDWAVFLLRYAAYAPPRRGGEVVEIAADNALYLREQILREADLLEEGFFEPGFHARFRARGLGLRIDPSLRVTHRNRYTTGQFLRQRVAHGRAFGRERAEGLPWPRRLLLAVASPLLPFIFLGKIVAATRRNHQLFSNLLRASPWLTLFLLGWGAGEARGYIDSLAGRRSERIARGPA
jgi:hypothetical protein